MKKNYFKISKESVWWVTKHLIGIVILYILYLKFMPFGKQFTITKESFFEFTMQMIMLSFIIVGIYVILIEGIIQIIRWIISKMYPDLFRGISKFKIHIPITKGDIEKFDKQFTRKMIKIPEIKVKEKEHEYDFCDRIIKEVIEEKLRKVEK